MKSIKKRNQLISDAWFSSTQNVNLEQYLNDIEIPSDIYLSLLTKIKDFTKLHVDAALALAAQKAEICIDGISIDRTIIIDAYEVNHKEQEFSIDVDSILQAYPDGNII